jgi:hypothetical protein
MAAERSLKKLMAKETVQRAIDEDPVDLDRVGWLESCLRPIAVFPRRLNERMVFQTSVFTLHGGKVYSPEMRRHYAKKDRIPPPITLEQVNEANRHKPILRRFRIPRAAKKKILDSLFKLGIHEAMLFPEVDRQAGYLQRLWWYEQKTGWRAALDRLFHTLFGRSKPT